MATSQAQGHLQKNSSPSLDHIRLGGARECLKARGKYMGRSKKELVGAVQAVIKTKARSSAGVVKTLCISPQNGTRMPCDHFEIKQSIVGDCQSKSGHPTVKTAKIKNRGALLGKENLYVESLLCAVSIGDQQIVQEVVRGNSFPQTEEVWVTGDNVYISGIDMSWENFGIGDLLLFPHVAILNSGYPHFACWKYAVRAGNDPKNYINSLEGIMLRMRGIKGAVLLRKEDSSIFGIHRGDSVRIIQRGTLEYSHVLSQHRPPLQEGEVVNFSMEEHTSLSASAEDTSSYVDLLIYAGKEAARIDEKRYRRKLPSHVKLEIAAEQKAKM